jgi:hypothetical protein
VSKKHLPKVIFEVGAVAVARIHLATDKSIDRAVQSIWTEYERQCHDPEAIADLTSAATQILAWTQEKAFPALPQLLRHLQYFCQTFEDDGRPKKRKLLDGLWFQKDDYDPNRVQILVRKAQVYCVSAQAGLAPFAPDIYQ